MPKISTLRVNGLGCHGLCAGETALAGDPGSLTHDNIIKVQARFLSLFSKLNRDLNLDLIHFSKSDSNLESDLKV